MIEPRIAVCVRQHKDAMGQPEGHCSVQRGHAPPFSTAMLNLELPACANHPYENGYVGLRSMGGHENQGGLRGCMVPGGTPAKAFPWTPYVVPALEHDWLSAQINHVSFRPHGDNVLHRKLDNQKVPQLHTSTCFTLSNVEARVEGSLGSTCGAHAMYCHPVS